MNFFKDFKIAFFSPGSRPLLIASFLSNIGDWIYFVGMSALLYNTAGALAMTAFIIIRQCMYIVFSPFTGYIADRFPRKSLMLITDLLNGILMFILSFLSIQQINSISLYITLILLVVIFGLINRSARLVVIPKLVEKEFLLSLNALTNIIGTTSLTIAPVIAGLAMKMGGVSWTFLINGISFLLSLLCSLALPSSLNKIEGAKKDMANSYTTKFREITEGLSFVIRVSKARSITFFLITSHLVVGATWVFIPELSKLLQQGDAGIGYLNSAVGAGSVLGVFIGAWIGSKRLGTSAIIGVIGLSLSVLLCSISSTYSFSLLIATLVVYGSVTLMGIFANIADAPLWTMIQQVTNDSNAGRVYSAVDALTVGGMALGSFLAGWIISHLSLSFTLVVISIISLIMTGIFIPGIVRSTQKEKSISPSGESYGK
ncbi:MFS transporter [Geobacillus sp. FSL W8-0032]|uniref:MFS transporter n=1 Tax=unclassified Geobacillus TaxID=2642459 RepID=UPI0030DBC59E